jgi:hypothetical protein
MAKANLRVKIAIQFLDADLNFLGMLMEVIKALSGEEDHQPRQRAGLPK